MKIEPIIVNYFAELEKEKRKRKIEKVSKARASTNLDGQNKKLSNNSNPKEHEETFEEIFNKQLIKMKRR